MNRKQRRAKRPLGFVVYEGVTCMPGLPFGDSLRHIVVIAVLTSNNSKTGNMIQFYILVKNHPPMLAVWNGQDFSICGDCKHRGCKGNKRTCYVKIWEAVTQIYKSYKAGRYPRYNPAEDEHWFVGAEMRFGAYGDPAAAPFLLWDYFNSLTDQTVTGYTAQWDKVHRGWSEFCMASTSTPEEFFMATSAGWRCYHIGEVTEQMTRMGVTCPNVTKGRQCIKCGLCGG
jgi:hypothetical protein